MENNPAIVLDLGSDTIKAGFSVSQCPDFVLPNVVGRPLVPPGTNLLTNDFLFCDQTTPVSVNKTLNVTHPLERATVSQWDDECKILDYLFDRKMKTSPRDHCLMITEASLASRKYRKKLIEVFFEEYLIPSIHIQPEALCSLCAAGLTSGTVIEIGENATRVASIVDHQFVPKSCAHIKVGGAEVTQRLIKLFQLRRTTFPENEPVNPYRRIKESYCRVSKNISRRRALYEQDTAQFSTFSMANGRSIQLHREIYEPAEVLFEPSLIGQDGPGIVPLLFDSICHADPTIRNQITEHVVLSGGTALLPGLGERIASDTRNMIAKEVKGQNKHHLTIPDAMMVEAFSHSNILAYAGAAVCAQVYLNNEEYWAEKADYENDGVDAIVRRFKSATLRE
ncbi:Actin-related protein 2 [Tritrichomonas foetus]|uniref:Actin-related protein 2 n=1 Tax=Tritrichomonas foetus TaxID=1144522 RepID=A0A1J4KAQ4_9EUKA|nr:Actin-related protein 2 [Tritrichomonas foetus]|eukprot:OHT06758.1 Actin-related protein 2 [Tritrichomonas foetus]